MKTRIIISIFLGYMIVITLGFVLYSKQVKMEILYLQEKSYFQGQLDALQGRTLIIQNPSDSTWNWKYQSSVHYYVPYVKDTTLTRHLEITDVYPFDDFTNTILLLLLQ